MSKIKQISTWADLMDIAERLAEMHSRLEEVSRGLMRATEALDPAGVHALIQEYKNTPEVPPFRVDGKALRQAIGEDVSDAPPPPDDSGNDSGEGWVN